MDTRDKFVQKLLSMREELQRCQTERQLESCFNCGTLLQCDLRRNYVKAVYESMSKGETGGFEF